MAVVFDVRGCGLSDNFIVFLCEQSSGPTSLAILGGRQFSLVMLAESADPIRLCHSRSESRSFSFPISGSKRRHQSR
jgi:hypothetical protein